MRRLYLQIYATVVAVLVMFTFAAGGAWLVLHQDEEELRVLDTAALLVDAYLPAADSPERLESSLRELAERLPAQVSLFDAQGARLASVGEPLAAPERPERSLFRFLGRGRHEVQLALRDGRVLRLRYARHAHGAAWTFLASIAGLAALVAAAAYPLVRRLTGRLERLRGRVDQLGRGELAARVEVEGGDEVADLARSFNRAAERIERLVQAQRTLLASASHELRTPLARLRVGLELLGEGRPELRDRLARDVAELDQLIGELLLASRAEAFDDAGRREAIELLALLAEEAARFGAEVSGDAVAVDGDPILLRHLLRHLLENAVRHGAGSPIEASAVSDGALVRIAVADRGPGVPEHERQRIFEPFHRRGPGGGTGLGLALVERIARRHGGAVSYRPREGGGSVFEVALPRAGAPDRPA